MQKLVVLIAILVSMRSYAVVHKSLYSSPPSGQLSEEDLIKAEIIPPPSTQDGLGNCFSSAGAAYLDMLNCKFQIEKGQKTDCRNLKPEDSFSRLATGKFGRITPAEADISQYPGIYAEEGRNVSNILANVIYDGNAVTSEACASIEKALLNFQDNEQYRIGSEKLFSRLEARYKIINSRLKKCPTCASTLTGQDKKNEEDDLNLFASSLNVNNIDLLKSFAEETYGEFLEALLVPNCGRGKPPILYDGPPNSRVVNFPEQEFKSSNEKEKYSAVVKEIRNNLKQSTPVVLNNICTNDSYDTSIGCGGKKGDYHTLIITGYRKICNNKGTDCRDSVRVYNSYGASWQKKNNDGWVDAEPLLARTGYPKATLTYVKVASDNTAQTKNKGSTQNTGK